MRRFLSLLMLVFMEFTIAMGLQAMEEAIEPDAGKELYPQIEKVSNTLYKAKIKDKQLWLVMERIDDRTHPLWQKYISVQNNPRAVMLAQKREPHFTNDGSSFFQKVLKEISYQSPRSSKTQNEIWVAYITKADTPEIIPDSMKNYNAGNLLDDGCPFAQRIEMFVTVSSTSNALITTHMGVSASVEGAFFGRTKGITLDLHSFAAKVMRMRNPNRKYMVNAPVFPLERLIIKALPHSVFVGTREMRQVMKERQNISPQDYYAAEEAKTLKTFREEAERQKGNMENEIQAIKEKKNIDNTEKFLKKARKKILSNALVEINNDGHVIISEETIKVKVKEKMDFKKMINFFEGFKNPYLSPKDPETTTEEFLKLMEKHPPILSVDVEGNEKFTIFDPAKSSEVWLSFDRTNEDYQWMFTEPAKPAGVTHYFAVDLLDLANSKHVE